MSARGRVLAFLVLGGVVGQVRYHKMTHALAKGAGALAAGRHSRRWGEVSRLTPGLALSFVLTARGAEAMVEVAGYVGTLVVPNSNVGGYGNNMLDLIANLVGAGVATTAFAVGTRRIRHVATG